MNPLELPSEEQTPEAEANDSETKTFAAKPVLMLLLILAVVCLA